MANFVIKDFLNMVWEEQKVVDHVLWAAENFFFLSLENKAGSL